MITHISVISRLDECRVPSNLENVGHISHNCIVCLGTLNFGDFKKLLFAVLFGLQAWCIKLLWTLGPQCSVRRNSVDTCGPMISNQCGHVLDLTSFSAFYMLGCRRAFLRPMSAIFHILSFDSCLWCHKGLLPDVCSIQDPHLIVFLTFCLPCSPCFCSLFPYRCQSAWLLRLSPLWSVR